MSKKKIVGVPEPAPRDTAEHDRVYYEHLRQRKRGGRRAATPTNAEVLAHLEAMVQRHGAGVLEPYEVRLLARLKGEVPPAPPLPVGGHSHPLVLPPRRRGRPSARAKRVAALIDATERRFRANCAQAVLGTGPRKMRKAAA